MEDEELTRLRQQRLAQLQAAHGASNQGDPGMPDQPGGDNKRQQQQQQAKEREAEMRNNILSAVLTQEARARLSTLGAAKPDRAQLVENIIIQNVRMGGLRGKVDEEKLKELLERVATSQPRRETKISFERRRVFDDDDDEDE